MRTNLSKVSSTSAVVTIVILVLHGVLSLEVLPASAYLNRTMYPPLMHYVHKPQLSLGILSDVQYADQEEHQRRHFRKSLDKLNHAVDEMNANRTHLDMVLHLGDLVDHTMDRYLPAVEPILKRLKYPLYQLLGNHDFLGSPEASFSSLHQKLGMPARYYSLSAGPSKSYRLVMLDGNDIALYSTVSNSSKRAMAMEWKATLKRKRRKNAQKFNGALSDEQIVWMKHQLSEACNASQRVLLFLHHPLRPVGEPTNLWNDLEVVPIITSYPCVVAVVNGHAHKFLYDFHHTQFRDVHFVTFGGMVQSPFTSWGFVELYDEVMHVHGLVFGRAIDYRFNISSTAPRRLPAVPMRATSLDEAQMAGERGIDVVSVAPSPSTTRHISGGERGPVTAVWVGAGGEIHDTQGILGLHLVLVTAVSLFIVAWLIGRRRVLPAWFKWRQRRVC